MMVVALVLVVLAPILAQLLYFALSRRREYLADASAALYTRYPEGLARGAGEDRRQHGQPLKAANRTTAPMYIVNPLKLSAGGMTDRSSTHPPITERIRILRSLSGGRLSLERYNEAFRKVTGRAVGVVPAGSLAAIEAAEPRKPAADGRSHLERVRQVTDAMWHLQDYAFLACGCGTTMKVPPAHAGKEIPCAHCGEPHHAPRAA